MENFLLFSNIAFYSLSLVSIICALGMILNPNLVRAGFTLIGSFVAVAGLYFMLSANFVAVSQVLIYAVGIVLVIVFAIMLCSLKNAVTDVSDEEKEISSIQKITGAIVSTMVFLMLSFVLTSQDWGVIAKLTSATEHAQIIPSLAKNYTSAIGSLMLGDYILGFELISVLLLIILVGVVVLSKKNINK